MTLPSRTKSRAVLAGLVLALALAACEAGPSAFDRGSGADAGVPDSASAADLGEIPRAPEVEPADSSLALVEGERVPEEAGADSGDAAAGGVGNPDGGEGLATPGVGNPPEAGTRTATDDEMAEPGTPTDGGTDRLRFPRPDAVRGLYLNAWASGSTRRVDALLEVAERTEINSFVIDIKDASGYVSHRTGVPLADEIGATGEIRIRDLPGLLARLHEAGIYPIARIVIVKDPLLSAARPEMAVQDTAGGVWVDSKDIVWLNPFDSAVWDYHVELAREVAGMGFPEIQWDYVRFPDAPRSDLDRAVFPGAQGREKPEAIRAFLDHSRNELSEMGVTVTADVFGVTTSAARDVGIGQVWERFIDVVDVALPMVYPSHYWRGSFGIEEPNAFPYEIVKRALEDALRRSEAVEGAGATRPWLQDFSLGQPAYEAPEVRAQIQATYDAGIDEWILWNPGSRYTVDALEPADGWTDEPLIRVADQVVPVSERWELLEPEEADPVAADGEEGEEEGSGGSAGAGQAPPSPDTVGTAGPGLR